MIGIEILWNLIVLLSFWWSISGPSLPKCIFLRISKWKGEIINCTPPPRPPFTLICIPRTTILTKLHLSFPNTELSLFVLLYSQSQTHYKSANSPKGAISHFMGFSILWNIFLLKSCQSWKLSWCFWYFVQYFSLLLIRKLVQKIKFNH